MFDRRCINPAHLVISATKRINGHDEPLPPWFCCDDLRCILASQSHAAEYGVIHVDSRLITPADIEALTGQMEVAA
jgi:hypothetical protein